MPPTPLITTTPANNQGYAGMPFIFYFMSILCCYIYVQRKEYH